MPTPTAIEAVVQWTTPTRIDIGGTATTTVVAALRRCVDDLRATTAAAAAAAAGGTTPPPMIAAAATAARHPVSVASIRSATMAVDEQSDMGQRVVDHHAEAVVAMDIGNASAGGMAAVDGSTMVKMTCFDCLCYPSCLVTLLALLSVAGTLFRVVGSAEGNKGKRGNRWRMGRRS